MKKIVLSFIALIGMISVISCTPATSYEGLKAADSVQTAAVVKSTIVVPEEPIGYPIEQSILDKVNPFLDSLRQLDNTTQIVVLDDSTQLAKVNAYRKAAQEPPVTLEVHWQGYQLYYEPSSIPTQPYVRMIKETEEVDNSDSSMPTKEEHIYVVLTGVNNGYLVFSWSERTGQLRQLKLKLK